MNIRSAIFIKGVVKPDDILEDGKPQVAFIGRSNVGKSSTINAVTGVKDLAKTSSFPGRTQQVNVFLINKDLYLMDLPGYGYAKASKDTREKIQQLIYWYLLDSPYKQKKVVLIIDANVGVTEADSQMLYSLDEQEKNVVIVANKVDKIKASLYTKQMQKIEAACGLHKVIPFSAEKKIGWQDLIKEILE